MAMTGFRFRPKDDDIIGFYLKRLVTVGPPLPSMVRDIIRDIDIYGEAPPWEIAAQFPESKRDDFYIFTKLKKRSANRKVRTAEKGQGTWKGQSTRKKIVSWSGAVVGEKKTLSFMADNSENKKRVTSHWNMTEYSMLEMDGTEFAGGDEGYVICHVTHNNRPSGNNVATRKAAIQEIDYPPLEAKIKRACRPTKINQELSPQPPALTVVTPPPTWDAEFGGFLESGHLGPEGSSSSPAGGGADPHHQLSGFAATALNEEKETVNNESTPQPQLVCLNLSGFADAEFGGFSELDHLGADGSSSYSAGGGADPHPQLSNFGATALEGEMEAENNESTEQPQVDCSNLGGFGDADEASGDQYHQLSVSQDAYVDSGIWDYNVTAGDLSDPRVQSFDSSAECSYNYLWYDPAATVEAELDCLKQQGLSFFTDDAAINL